MIKVSEKMTLTAEQFTKGETSKRCQKESHKHRYGISVNQGENTGEGQRVNLTNLLRTCPCFSYFAPKSKVSYNILLKENES